MATILENYWPRDLTGYQEMAFFVGLLFCVHELVFWPASIILLLADKHGWWKDSKINKVRGLKGLLGSGRGRGGGGHYIQ